MSALKPRIHKKTSEITVGHSYSANKKKIQMPVPVAAPLPSSKAQQGKSKTKFNKPQEEQVVLNDDPDPDCSCNRKCRSIICTACNVFSFGRICQTCRIHKNVLYLMDFKNCPSCKGPIEKLQELDVDFEILKKINECKLKK